MAATSGKCKHMLGALNIGKTALFLCDVQEKFRPAMTNFDAIVENIIKIIKGCKELEVPLFVTEQYPSGLGHTVDSIPIDHSIITVPKTKFSMVIPEIIEKIDSMEEHLESVILCGIETHVCVEQTAIDLLHKGITVHIVADCCTSRSQEDRLFALQRLQQIGCFITTSESVLFKLLGDKQHPKFKDVAKLLKPLTQPTGLISRI